MSYADEPIVLWLDFTKKLWYTSFQISTALKSRFSIDNWWDRVNSHENWRIHAWHPNLNVLKAYFGSILYMPKWGFGGCWNNCCCICSSWASRRITSFQSVLACRFMKESLARLIPFMYTQGTRMAGRQTTNSSVQLDVYLFNWSEDLPTKIGRPGFLTDFLSQLGGHGVIHLFSKLGSQNPPHYFIGCCSWKFWNHCHSTYLHNIEL